MSVGALGAHPARRPARISSKSVKNRWKPGKPLESERYARAVRVSSKTSVRDRLCEHSLWAARHGSCQGARMTSDPIRQNVTAGNVVVRIG